MKMTTGLLIGLLILITSIGLYACKGKIQGKEKVNQEEDKVKKTKVKDNPPSLLVFAGLRRSKKLWRDKKFATKKNQK